jgi:tripartite-type tricarboxylate transporter receptor subunit TctC
MLKIFNALVLVVLLLSGLHGGGAAAASENPQANYPNRPVRIVVPFPPGGSDVIARMVAQRLYEKLGHPFVVDNRPGAAGTLGVDIVSKASADGYTLLFATASFPVTAVSYKKLPFDPIKDFAPIGFVGSVPFMLVTHPSLPARSLKEFIALAKAQPGKLNYSSTGLGSVGHLATVLLTMQTGIDVTHVAYKGTGPAVTALLVGEVQFMMPNLIGGLSLVRAGKLKCLGVASRERSPLARELPTLDESGLPGFDEGTWYGVMAPAGTPMNVIEMLNREITALLQTRDLRDKVEATGVIIRTSTPDEFQRFVRAEIEKWGRVMKEGHINPT